MLKKMDFDPKNIPNSLGEIENYQLSLGERD